MVPMIFCNIGWMAHYTGLSAQEKIEGVTQEYLGHEVCNFAAAQNNFYGYVQHHGELIEIERLGAGQSDEEISGVTVIWTARRPVGGTVVVGWYEDATVYRYLQRFTKMSALHKKHGIDSYRVKAEASNGRLLPIDERTFAVPKGVKGGMGQANVWHADTPGNKELLEALKKLLTCFRPCWSHYHA